MTFYIRVTSPQGECLDAGYRELSNHAQAESYAQSIAGAYYERYGQCDWSVVVC